MIVIILKLLTVIFGFFTFALHIHELCMFIKFRGMVPHIESYICHSLCSKQRTVAWVQCNQDYLWNIWDDQAYSRWMLSFLQVNQLTLFSTIFYPPVYKDLCTWLFNGQTNPFVIEWMDKNILDYWITCILLLIF